MEPTYTLWCNGTLVDEGMTEDEFIEELLELHVDFSFDPENNYYIIYNNNYWYEINSAGIL
jgi:hypothetical protein